jgi:hypothetical protein
MRQGLPWGPSIPRGIKRSRWAEPPAASPLEQRHADPEDRAALALDGLVIDGADAFADQRSAARDRLERARAQDTRHQGVRARKELPVHTETITPPAAEQDPEVLAAELARLRAALHDKRARQQYVLGQGDVDTARDLSEQAAWCCAEIERLEAAAGTAREGQPGLSTRGRAQEVTAYAAMNRARTQHNAAIEARSRLRGQRELVADTIAGRRRVLARAEEEGRPVAAGVLEALAAELADLRAIDTELAAVETDLPDLEAATAQAERAWRMAGSQ